MGGRRREEGMMRERGEREVEVEGGRGGREGGEGGREGGRVRVQTCTP